jgi:HSP20 family protein
VAVLSERRWPSLWSGRWGSRSWPTAILPPVPDWWVDREALHLEEFRENGTLVVRAELPGIDPDRDVEITVAEGTLCIRAERREKHEERGDGDFYRSEFHYGQFSRTLPLPRGVGADEVIADYTDGILEVRLPLREAGPGPVRVAVSRGSARTAGRESLAGESNGDASESGESGE